MFKYNCYLKLYFGLSQGHSSIDCTWNGFIDDESPIDMFVVSFGTQKGYDDIYISDPIPGYQSRYSTTGESCISDTTIQILSDQSD